MDNLFQQNRRKLLKIGAALPLGAVLPLAPFGALASTRGIAGQVAPELDVEFWLDKDGKPTKFSMLEQRGKWVYLKCWQAWCPGCHSHGFPNLQKVTNAFLDDDRVVTVGLQTTFEGHDINGKSRVREMQLRYELPIVMGHDPGKSNEGGYPNTMMSYRTGGTPWQIIINPDGIVYYDGFRVDADKVIDFIKEELTKMG